MSNLERLQENISSDILMYLDSYLELSQDDSFALKTDLVQIVIDRIEEEKDKV
tara:strand:- start:2902 stop:3060 length:159 start_codon:yes stop_codon:yes gene_type:complete